MQRLSGGNQQKIAIAKWLPLSPVLFLLNDPTRGVDIETKREIYLRLRQMAASGTAVVLLSSDTLELVHVCDRVAVFSQGRIAAMLGRDELSEEAIVAASVGAAAGGADRSGGVTRARDSTGRCSAGATRAARPVRSAGAACCWSMSRSSRAF